MGKLGIVAAIVAIVILVVWVVKKKTSKKEPVIKYIREEDESATILLSGMSETVVLEDGGKKEQWNGDKPTEVIPGNTVTEELPESVEKRQTEEQDGGQTLSQNAYIGDNPTELMEEAAVKMYGTVRVLSGEVEGAEVRIEDGHTLYIGRDAEKCNIIFDESYVSRVHVKIRFEFDFSSGATFYVTDMSSTGTSIRNESAKGKETIHALNPNDEVKAQVNDVILFGDQVECVKLLY